MAMVALMPAMIQRHDVEVTQPNTTLGYHAVCKFPDISEFAFQYRDFQAILSVDMNVQGRYRQVVMVMLCACQPLRQFPGLVFVNIRQGREASGIANPDRLLAGDGFANDIAKRFGPARIAALFAQPIDRFQKIVIDRDGDALHGGSIKVA